MFCQISGHGPSFRSLAVVLTKQYSVGKFKGRVHMCAYHELEELLKERMRWL